MLLLLDVDNFKKVNDTYGHLCGDEFLIFCPDCGIGGVLEQKIQNLQNSFYTFRSQSVNNPQVSVSIGAALFAKADQALYISKSEGKNRCTFYSTDTLVIDRQFKS